MFILARKIYRFSLFRPEMSLRLLRKNRDLLILRCTSHAYPRRWYVYISAQKIADERIYSVILTGDFQSFDFVLLLLLLLGDHLAYGCPSVRETR